MRKELECASSILSIVAVLVHTFMGMKILVL